MNYKNNSHKSLDTNEKEKEHPTAIGLYSVKNLLGHENQLSLFDRDQIQDFGKTYGIQVQDNIDRFGIDLTDIQSRVMEGILRGFSLTDYKGNMASKEKADLIREKYAFGDLPAIYKNIKIIPCLRATQAEIIKWAGMNTNSIAERERLVDALNHLATTQYCFYYDRIAVDKNGNPEKGSDGKWKQQEVVAVSTLFEIKEIRNKSSGAIEYYEITPSAIFLDQRESNFMLIPHNWREDVKAIVGSKKTSSYTFRFLLFLRYQHELMRRSNHEEGKQFKIISSWEDVAIAIKMPESVYKRKKERALKILDEAFYVAKEAGYLLSYDRDGSVVTLILNGPKYYSSDHSSFEEKSTKLINHFTASAHELWELFNEEKFKNDPKHKISEALKPNSLREFEKLLEEWSKEEIIQVVCWGLRLKLWHNRLSSPAKLRQNIAEAMAEMNKSSTSEYASD